MKFANRAEKMKYLKQVADKIRQMEQDRKVAIIKGDFARAYKLITGIQFARRIFGKISSTLKH